MKYLSIAILALLIMPSISIGAAIPTGTGTTFANATTLKKLGTGPNNTLTFKGQQIVGGGGVGTVGPPGPAGTAATIAIGVTATGAAGSSAAVTNSGNSTAAVLNFTVPRGNTGPQGSTGAAGPQGVQGPQGIQGPQGPQGPQGVAGGSMSWRGTYSALIEYYVNDAVSYGSPASSYIAVADSLGYDPPANPAKWNVIAFHGYSGARGFRGYSGARGPSGIDGGSLNFTGTWSSSTTYALRDVVEYNGSSFAAKRASTNAPPWTPPAAPTTAQNLDWQLQAKKGADGAQGSQGIQGPTGATGPQGIAGSAGPQGTQGIAGPAGPNTLSSSTTTAFSGLIKGNGSTVSAATPDVDFPALATFRAYTSLDRPAKSELGTAAYRNMPGNIYVQSTDPGGSAGDIWIDTTAVNQAVVPTLAADNQFTGVNHFAQPPTGSGALLTGVLHSADYEAINVHQRGIKGDGTDEGAAIQALFNAAEDGDSFYFPQGVYGSSVKITLPQELSIEITGDGPKQTIFKALASMTSFFYKAGGSTVVERAGFSDFGIDCNMLSGIGMELQTYKQAKLDRLYATDWTGTAAFLLGKPSGSGGGGTNMFYEAQINSIEVYLHTSKFPDQSTRPLYGMVFQSTASDNTVTKVVAAYAKTAGILDGAYGSNSFVQIHPWGSSSYPMQYGIITHGNSSIANCEFDTCATAGVGIDTATGDVTITGNMFNAPTGVEIASNAPGISIVGNRYNGVINKYVILGAGTKGAGFTFTEGFDSSALSSLTVGLGNVTNDAQLKASQLVTTIGATGSDSNVPSEKATRAAISAAVSAAGGGNVTGPASATNGHMAVFSGTDGKTIADGGPVGSGTIIAVTATAPVASSGGTAPVISMEPATDSVSGYLTSTDHATFAAKAPSASPVLTGSPSVTPTFGSNLVTNGTFATDASSWTTTGWTWGSGKVTHTTGNTNTLTQSGVSIVAGNTYRITYDVSGMTAGTVNVSTSFGGGVTHIVVAANVTGLSYVFTATANSSLGFNATSNFDGAIDNVILTQVTGGNFSSGDGFNVVNDGLSVGIGTQTPSAPLEIFGDGAKPVIAMLTSYSGGDNSNQSPSFVGRGARGTPSAPIQSKTNDQLSAMSARGHDGTSFSAFTKGVMGIYAAENWTSIAQGTYIGFQTTASGGTTRAVKALVGNGLVVKSGATISDDPGAGLVSANNTIYSESTSSPSTTGTVTINAAAVGHYELTPTGTTTQTIAFSGNPAAGKVTYVGIHVTTAATGVTTLAWPTVGSTFGWLGATAGATTLAASKGYEYACRVESTKTWCGIVGEGF